MKSRRKIAHYYKGPEAAARFEQGLADLLRVSKQELEKREAQYEESRRHKPRRGPKPKDGRNESG